MLGYPSEAGVWHRHGRDNIPGHVNAVEDSACGWGGMDVSCLIENMMLMTKVREGPGIGSELHTSNEWQNAMKLKSSHAC